MRTSKLLFRVSVLGLSAVLLSCSPKSDPKPAPSKDISVKSEATQKFIEISNDSLSGYQLTQDLTTNIGQRLAGTKKEAKARAWAIQAMNGIGLQNVRIEEFDMDAWTREVETAEIVGEHAQELFITALGGSVSTPAGGLTAPIVYFDSFEALTDSPAEGLEGKIAYITGKMERHRDGAGYGPANKKRRSGASEAGKRGAIAVLIRSVGTDSHRFPHTGQMRYQDGITPIPIAALSAPDADQIDRLHADGKDINIHLNIQTHIEKGVKSGNVIGEIVGTEKPQEIVLIGAHLDSWDLGTGAIDDGAGVGIVMGAADTILKSGLKPKRTIRVVLFGAEEVGLLGGFAYAKQHEDDLKNHIMATESDFGAERIYGFQMGKHEASRALYNEIAAALSSVGIEKIDGATGGGPDITPLYQAGVPTLRLKQDGTDYFDLHHTPDDTFDKIDPLAMRQNVTAYAIFAYMAAQTQSQTRDQ